MVNWEGIKCALDPTLICRRYMVQAWGWGGGGYNYYFWSLKKAKAKYTGIFRADRAMCVTLTDTFVADEPAPQKLDNPGTRYAPVDRVIWTSGQMRMV